MERVASNTPPRLCGRPSQAGRVQTHKPLSSSPGLPHKSLLQFKCSLLANLGHANHVTLLWCYCRVGLLGSSKFRDVIVLLSHFFFVVYQLLRHVETTLARCAHLPNIVCVAPLPDLLPPCPFHTDALAPLLRLSIVNPQRLSTAAASNQSNVPVSSCKPAPIRHGPKRQSMDMPKPQWHAPRSQWTPRGSVPAPRVASRKGPPRCLDGTPRAGKGSRSQCTTRRPGEPCEGACRSTRPLLGTVAAACLGIDV